MPLQRWLSWRLFGSGNGGGCKFEPLIDGKAWRRSPVEVAPFDSPGTSSAAYAAFSTLNANGHSDEEEVVNLLTGVSTEAAPWILSS